MGRDAIAERDDILKEIGTQTIPQVLEESAKAGPDIKALNWKENGEWKHLTFAQYRDAIRDVANGWLAIGMEPGDFVAIMARNVPAHYLSDLGAVHARGVGVSLYNTLSPEQIAFIVGHCEAKFVVAENRDFLEQFLKIKEEIPKVERVILVDGAEEFEGDDWILSWDQFLEQGREFGKKNPQAFEDSWKKVKQNDLLTLIYTSGTTGHPKGVMIDHLNVLFAGHTLTRLGDRTPGDRVISYLPLAHIAERAGSLYIAPTFLTEVYLCPEVTEMLPTLLEVKPTIFFGVPRVFERIYSMMNAALAGESDESRKQMAEWAIGVGRQVVQYEQKGETVPEDLAQLYQNADQVLSQIRARIGLDEARHVISGAAPISTEVLEFFHAIGMKIAEVYGQTEDTGPTSLNPKERIKIGTVGPACPGLEVKLAEDGEILVRGPSVSEGYYKDPELTAETFDSERWLHSGDIAEMDEDGYLRIIDRKKEIIITAGGKNIAPSNLENALKQHPLIGQAAVIGDRRKFVSALIVLDAEMAPMWGQGHGIASKTVDEMSADPQVNEEIQKWIDEVNKQFSHVEQIKRFTILPTEWTAESEELTPTLKLKRRVIEQKYEDQIDRLYSDK